MRAQEGDDLVAVDGAAHGREPGEQRLAVAGGGQAASRARPPPRGRSATGSAVPRPGRAGWRRGGGRPAEGVRAGPLAAGLEQRVVGPGEREPVEGHQRRGCGPGTSTPCQNDMVAKRQAAPPTRKASSSRPWACRSGRGPRRGGRSQRVGGRVHGAPAGEQRQGAAPGGGDERPRAPRAARGSASGRRGSGRCLAQYSSAHVSKGKGLPTSRWSVLRLGQAEPLDEPGGTVAEVSTAGDVGSTAAAASRGPTSMGDERGALVRPDGPDSTQATWSSPSADQAGEVLGQVPGREQGPVAASPRRRVVRRLLARRAAVRSLSLVSRPSASGHHLGERGSRRDRPLLRIPGRRRRRRPAPFVPTNGSSAPAKRVGELGRPRRPAPTPVREP